MNSGLQVSVGIIIQNQLLANKVKYQLQRLQQFELAFEYETIKEYEFNQKRIQSHPQVLLLELDTRDHQHLDWVRFHTAGWSRRLHSLEVGARGANPWRRPGTRASCHQGECDTPRLREQCAYERHPYGQGEGGRPYS